MIFTDFKLGNRTLSSFGGKLYNPDGVGKINMLPELSPNTIDIPNKHGTVFNGIYAKQRTWTENIYIEVPQSTMQFVTDSNGKILVDSNGKYITVEEYINDNFNIPMMKSWLINNFKEQQFNYVGDNKITDVVCTNIGELEVYNPKQLLLTVEFTAYNPFWRIEYETNIIKTNIAASMNYKIVQNGNVESEPWIYITPTSGVSNIKFRWNDLDVTLTGLDTTKRTLINCETEEVFEVGATMVGAMNKYTSNEWYDFPKLNPYDLNRFTLLEGSIDRLEIQLNSRII